ncbi:hypothetical protein DFJ73DRAFT_808129 [Zopfochytrium polystomum]|nr:hypothetical protein DFJ73DRAFT_808129 [Zopfochytrium polystomum]
MEAAAHGPPAATATANEVFLEAAAHLARESFDESRALFVYNAKTNNHAESMYVLGQLWETGHGVPAADVDVARGWYRKASDLGNDKAAKRLRDMNAVTFPFLAMMRGQNVDVDIKMERLNDVMVAAIADELSGNNHVVSLRLASDRPTNQIDDTDVMALAKALRKNTHLKELHLCGHRITNSGANSLASAIMVNSTLQLLDLSNNRIGSHGARALAQALLTDGVAVKSLNLRCNRIGNAGAEDFAETFHENKVLQKLDLSLNQITSIGASAFGKALGKCSLHEFIIAENQIDDRGAEQIAQGLESGSCALTVLSMRANSIGAAGAEAFARLLKVNNVLQELDLAHNSIQDAGAKALALGLESNESLLILDIAGKKFALLLCTFSFVFWCVSPFLPFFVDFVIVAPPLFFSSHYYCFTLYYCLKSL